MLLLPRLQTFTAALLHVFLLLLASGRGGALPLHVRNLVAIEILGAKQELARLEAPVLHHVD